jgi:Tol biopolymer transport system component
MGTATPPPSSVEATATASSAATPATSSTTTVAGPGRIAYVGTDGNIWAVNPDGINKVKLTLESAESGPIWSSDGSLIAYVGPNGGIRAVDIRTSEPLRLTSTDDSSRACQWNSGANVQSLGGEPCTA